MNNIEAIKNRHSVRSYSNQEIEGSVVETLKAEILKCNQESGLNVQLVLNEKEAFNSLLAYYGKFRGVSNYIAMVGPKGNDLHDKVGYYGEKIVILAQRLGLNTCWVGATYSKRKSRIQVEKGQKLVCVISLGYGLTPGISHKSKPLEKLSQVSSDMPEWFQSGLEMASLAPTAVNQQKFLITLDKDEVIFKSMGGFFSKVDLGIVRYHFEVGSQGANYKWRIEK